MNENTALEELQFIRKVIEESKRSFVDNGMYYIVWGVLVIIGLCTTYILVLNRIFFNYIWLWLGIISVGWIFSFYYGSQSKEKHPLTFSNKIVNSVWLATGIAMTILGFIGPASGAVAYHYVSPVLSVPLGAAYFVTGYIVESKWFSYLSIGWWTGAIYMFFSPGVHSILVMAMMMLFFQTVPGIIMFRKYKHEMAA